MRNYEKEMRWSRDKYDQIKISIDKELASDFRNKVKNNKTTITSVLRNKIEEYVKKGS